MATKTQQKIIDLERKYWQAIKEKDIDTMVRLSDDPGIVTGPQGIALLDRQTLEQMMQGANWSLEEYELGDDIQVRLLGKDVAIVAYKVHEELTVDGKPVTMDAADASTWVRRNGGWVCALHTEAITGDPFGRDRRAMS